MSNVGRQKETSEFEAQSRGKRSGFLAEFYEFLKHNKKWWLLPIIIMLLILGFLVVVSGTLGPFIYPLL